jgi:hypothetical protein
MSWQTWYDNLLPEDFYDNEIEGEEEDLDLDDDYDYFETNEESDGNPIPQKN